MSTTSPTVTRLRGLASLRGRNRVLHATTLAFFLSFVVWFNYAPFSAAIGKDLGLTPAQLTTLALCNLALTIPARIVVGMLLDRFGPRRLYAGVLIFSVIPNTLFATAQSFGMLVASRLALGVVGAGFVVGIRLVAEWFEHRDTGTAEGIYGGWGNFGSAGAALLLPTLATYLAGGESAWRWGVGISGVVAALYGVAFLFLVSDTPHGATYARPTNRRGALEVTSRKAVAGLVALQVPLFAALALVAWRIERVAVISPRTLGVVLAVLAVGFLWQSRVIVRANPLAMADAYPAEDRYPFASVVMLSLAYMVTFGTELAVIGLLPTFFASTFGLQIAAAGAAGSAFALTNLLTRPGGGIASDAAASRRRVLVVLLVGVAACFAVMTQLSGAWPLAAGIGLVALASVFVQGGNGAVFAMVPLVKRRVGGQVAGMAGAYGNVGGVALTSLLFFSAGADGRPNVSLMFGVIAVGALTVALLCRWLPESTPERSGDAHVRPTTAHVTDVSLAVTPA